MEKGIGETFIFKGERYMVCEQTAKNVSHCWDCAFRHVSCGALELGECGRKFRADNKNVFFYKIVDNKENENMNKKIDLTELLRYCPLETRFYMSVLGEQVKLDSILKTATDYPIVVRTDDATIFHLSKYGQLYAQYAHGDCVLWPSKECGDWSKFKAPIKKFDPKTLMPFDRVLVKVDRTLCTWKCALFSHIDKNKQAEYSCSGLNYKYCIPYNDDTKHILGTSDEAPEYYKYWEE